MENSSLITDRSYESRHRNKKILIIGIIGILVLLTLICGCIGIPFFPNGTSVEGQSISKVYYQDTNLPPLNSSQTSLTPEYVYPDFPIQKQTPEPTPTPLISNISDWNPYSILPYPEQPLNHSSIYKNDTPNYRKILNTTYSGTVGLNGYAIGKELNITTGPFSITYTVHPNITSPLNVWVKLTVLDPRQNIISEAGYNRGYPDQETQTMIIYRQGRFYLTIEGDFVSVDYTIKTGDPIPEVALVTPAPVPNTEEMEMEHPY